MATLYWAAVATGTVYKCDGASLTSFEISAVENAGVLVLGPDRILAARECDTSDKSGGWEVDLDLTAATARPNLTWSDVELMRDFQVGIGVYDADEGAYWLHLAPGHVLQGVITGVYAYWAKVSPEGTVLAVYANDWDGAFFDDADNPAEGNAVLTGGYLYWNSDGRGLLFRMSTSTGVVEWLSLIGTPSSEGDTSWAAPVGATADGLLVMVRRETISDGEERHYVGTYDLSAAAWSSSGAGGALPVAEVEWPMQVDPPADNVSPAFVVRPGNASGWARSSGDFLYYYGWEFSGPSDHYSIWQLSLTDGSFTQFANLDATDGLGYLGTDIIGMVVYDALPSITGEALDNRRRFAP